MDKENAFRINGIHKYLGLSLDTPLIEVECTCRGEREVACKRILPTGTNTKGVIVYNSCRRTLFAALRRQLKLTSPPDPKVVPELHKFMDEYFDKYIEPHLRDFDYSFSQWYNHQPRHKQDALDRIDPSKIEEVVYGLFCKREKQEMGGKNRAISNISNETKFVMGPVIWMLEELADKFFPGYCGKKNWNDLEKYYNEAYQQGFRYVVQGDGSAFDLSQHNDCKYIDFKIYSYLADRKLIHHVPNDTFKKVATQKIRKLKASYFVNGVQKVLGTALVQGTVFSGSSDTTFANTLRMAIYNMFTLEKAGLRFDIDYKLLCKGDDFLVLVKEMRDYDGIYYKYWCKAVKDPMTYSYEPYGIGQVLKFLVVGDYSTLDFCSTTVIPYNADGATKFKIARKVDRMNPLSHYSRAALQMSALELKQYYLDLAMSIDVSMPNMPFYASYSEAFKYHASRIPGIPIRLTTGRKRLTLPDDGHRKIDDSSEIATYIYKDYGRDFVEGLKNRLSSTKIPEEYVYNHLRTKYGLSYNDIQLHARNLRTDLYLYDHIADNSSL